MRRSKTALRYYDRYLGSGYVDLNTAYCKCSQAKEEAWEYCKSLCEEYDGYGLRVIGRNVNYFTAGFMFPHPDTGELCFAYITKSGEIWHEV